MSLVRDEEGRPLYFLSQIEDVTDDFGILSIQGPRSREILASVAPAVADLAYFADTAHMPYGSKPDDFIRGRVLAAATETSLRNVRVQATSDLGAAPPVFTDDEGRFVTGAS